MLENFDLTLTSANVNVVYALTAVDRVMSHNLCSFLLFVDSDGVLCGVSLVFLYVICTEV